jgi:hypothetical protein
MRRVLQRRDDAIIIRDAADRAAGYWLRSGSMMQNRLATRRGLTSVDSWRFSLAALLMVVLPLVGMAASAGVAEAATVQCSPRPCVIVNSDAGPFLYPAVIGLPGQDMVAVTITTTGADNALRAVLFTASTNAVVSYDGWSGHPAPYETTFAPGSEPTRLEFGAWRPNAGQSAFLRIIVVDACGEWTTFVGRGARSR